MFYIIIIGLNDVFDDDGGGYSSSDDFDDNFNDGYNYSRPRSNRTVQKIFRLEYSSKKLL